MENEVELPELEAVEKYLADFYGEIEDVRLVKLGTGVHGAGYRVDYRSITRGREERVILKTLIPRDFGHDHRSDRAAVHLLASENYSGLPNHIRCLDVVGYDGKGLASIRKTREFYTILEEARGEEYSRDLTRIIKQGSLLDSDRKRADMVANYLVKIHSERYSGINARSLYRRKIRESIGHGECLMGIFDTYEDWGFLSRQDMVEIVRKSISHWDRLKDNEHRLCQVHGNFYPGNIWFHGNDLVLLDRCRGSWGEAADDLSYLILNFIFYSLISEGAFRGPFAELFRRIYDRYLNLSWDNDVLEAVPLFMASRVPMMVNPKYFPNVDDPTRKKLIRLAKNVLDEDKFDVEKVSDYLGI